MSEAYKLIPMKNTRMYLVPYTYHEAGHAVVDHIIGRCIQEISLLSA